MAFITSSADALTLLLEIDAGNSRRHRLDAAGRVYEHGAVDPLGESARNAHDHAPLTRSRQHARRGRFCGAQTARLSAWKVPRQRGALQIEIRRAGEGFLLAMWFRAPQCPRGAGNGSPIRLRAKRVVF